MTTPKHKKRNRTKRPKKYLVMGKYYTREQLAERIGQPLGEGPTDAVDQYLEAHYGKDSKS